MATVDWHEKPHKINLLSQSMTVLLESIIIETLELYGCRGDIIQYSCLATNSSITGQVIHGYIKWSRDRQGNEWPILYLT